MIFINAESLSCVYFEFHSCFSRRDVESSARVAIFSMFKLKIGVRVFDRTLKILIKLSKPRTNLLTTKKTQCDAYILLTIIQCCNLINSSDSSSPLRLISYYFLFLSWDNPHFSHSNCYGLLMLAECFVWLILKFYIIWIPHSSHVARLKFLVDEFFSVLSSHDFLDIESLPIIKEWKIQESTDKISNLHNFFTLCMLQNIFVSVKQIL